MPEATQRESNLPPLRLPPSYGYVAAFLTLRCNSTCDYCINRFAGSAVQVQEITAAQWVAGLNRIDCPPDLPITLQGGEPSLHRGFLEIIAGLRPDRPIDLLTNLKFDVDRFMRDVPASRLRRDAPYASIRVSYHPGQDELSSLIDRVLRMQRAGYSIGLWMVDPPEQVEAIQSARRACLAVGIDFRLKEFLGWHAGRLFGTYRYPAAVAGTVGPAVRCRTTELILGPGGEIYRCHGDLYAGRSPIAHLLDPESQIQDVDRPCDRFGLCNPCDIKVKTNRFQQPGHTSVSIVLVADSRQAERP